MRYVCLRGLWLLVRSGNCSHMVLMEDLGVKEIIQGESEE